MEEGNNYSYRPLQQNQIRLLTFLRDESHVSAVLETFRVDEPLPQYHTLSYTWACDQTGLEKDWSLEIDQQNLPVLSSLRPFVQALEARGPLTNGTRWWIDSICIDQSNLEERAQQVQLMHHIYCRAHKVVVWLGAQSTDSNLAIGFIKVLDGIFRQQYDVNRIRLMLDQEQYISEWKALSNFFARKWWTRVWTIQEFVMPPSLSFWCGTEEVGRTAVCHSLSVTDKCSAIGIRNTIAFRHGFNRRRVWALYMAGQKRDVPPSRSLVSLAAYFCFSDSTDDRDRLYGLLALSTDRALLPAVDYSLSLEEVYMQFARSFIEHHRSLDIICFASVYSAAEASGLPSWVPDWHKRDAYLVVPVMVSQSANTRIGNLRAPHQFDHDPSVFYMASRGREARCEFQGSLLFARGVVIDAVDGLAGSGGAELVQSSDWNPKPLPNNVSASVRSTADIIQSICRCLALDRKDRFLQTPMPTDEFLHDFCRLCTMILTEAHASAPEALAEWFQRTKALRIDGRSIGTILREGQREVDFSRDPEPNQDEFIQDSFFGRFFDTVLRMALRLMVSRHGRLGMVSEKAEKGDLVCVLDGCSVPVLLRKSNDGANFVFIGECFLDGCMYGSALDQDELLERTFCIQ